MRDSVDMSPQAIDGRLRELAELWRLWQALRTAERLGPIDTAEKPTSAAPEGKTTDAPRRRP